MKSGTHLWYYTAWHKGRHRPPELVRFERVYTLKGYKCVVHDNWSAMVVPTTCLYLDKECKRRLDPAMMLLVRAANE